MGGYWEAIRRLLGGHWEATQEGAAPGGTSFWLQPEDVEEYAPVMTEFVRQVSRMVRQRPGQPGEIGARIYPTAELNRQTGLDVHTWLQEGLVDYLVPMVYVYFVLDGNMPIDWLVQTARGSDVSVYGVLQPYTDDESIGGEGRTWIGPREMRAAASSLLDRGCDGIYTWFLRWPLEAAERSGLSELGDRDLMREREDRKSVV